MTPFEKVRKIRAMNNDLWMAVLETALRAAPEETRQILKMIEINDRQISECLRKL